MDMSLLGIIVALVVLIIICYRKFNPVVGTLICVAILAIFSGLSVLDTITDTYFTGFSDFLKNNFLLFATGTVFASIMEGSGAAAAFAKMIYSKVGGRGAIYGCMLAVLILGYIGVNGWALMFSADRCQNLVTILKFYFEKSVWQFFYYYAFHFNNICF